MFYYGDQENYLHGPCYLNNNTVLFSDSITNVARFFYPFFIVIGITIISINSLVLLSYFKIKSRRNKVQNYLLFIQAVADASLGLLIILYYMFRYVLKHNLYNHLIIGVLARDFFLLFSINTLLVTSVERFLAVVCPLVHRTCASCNFMTFGTTLVTVLSLIPCSLYALVTNRVTLEVPRKLEIAYNMTLALTLVVGTWINILILTITARYARRSIKRRIDTAKNLYGSKSSKKGRWMEIVKIKHLKTIRLLKLFLTIASIHSITLTPYALFILFHEAGLYHDIENKDVILYTLYVFYTSNAIFNPILTLTIGNDYHRQVRWLCRQIRPGTVRPRKVEKS